MIKKVLLTGILLLALLPIFPHFSAEAACTNQTGTYTQFGMFTSAEFDLAAGESVTASATSNMAAVVSIQFIGLVSGIVGGGTNSASFTTAVNDTFVVTLSTTDGALVTYSINGGTCASGTSGFAAACGANEYNNFNVVKVFRQSNGVYNVFGNCNDSTCREIASINPNAFVSIDHTATQGTTFRAFQSAGSGGWFARVYPISPEGQARVYQVNVYDAGFSLKDDSFWIYVYPDNTTAWKSRLCPTVSGRIPITATGVQASTVVTTPPTNPTITTTTTTPITFGTGSIQSTGDGGARERAMGTFANGIYTVAPGDNLFRISLRFNVSMQAIMAANGISNPNVLFAGQQLRIP